MDTQKPISTTQIHLSAKRIWESEHSSSAMSRKASKNRWKALSDRERHTYLVRAKQALSQTENHSGTETVKDRTNETGAVRQAGELSKSTCHYPSSNTNPREQIDQRLPSINKLGDGEIVRNSPVQPVIHNSSEVTLSQHMLSGQQTARYVGSSTEYSASSNKLYINTNQPPASHQTANQGTTTLTSERQPPRVYQSGSSAQTRETNCAGSHQTQQFYAMSSDMQKKYLERELQECRRIMTIPQCKQMLNEYKEEFMKVRGHYLAYNNTVVNGRQPGHLEAIQRSILYNKVEHHKQQALKYSTEITDPITPENVQERFNNLVDYIIENGTMPRISAPTYSQQLTDILDVISSIPTHATPDEALSEETRKSESYTNILKYLRDEEVADVGVISNCEQLLPECDIPNLLTLSNSALDLHLSTE